MAGHIDALVIGCMDFRTQTKLRAMVQDLGIDDSFDLVTWPGATQEIANKQNLEGWKKVLYVAVKLHNTRKIIIIHHQDCGAYGGWIAIKHDLDHERKMHLNDATKAAIWFKEQFEENKAEWGVPESDELVVEIHMANIDKATGKTTKIHKMDLAPSASQN